MIAAEVAAVEEAADPFGRVELGRLSWSQVRSLFADEAGSAERLAECRRSAAGLALEQAVDDERIETLLDECDLLWFAPEELDRLPEPAG